MGLRILPSFNIFGEEKIVIYAQAKKIKKDIIIIFSMRIINF